MLHPDKTEAAADATRLERERLVAIGWKEVEAAAQAAMWWLWSAERAQLMRAYITSGHALVDSQATPTKTPLLRVTFAELLGFKR